MNEMEYKSTGGLIGMGADLSARATQVQPSTEIDTTILALRQARELADYVKGVVHRVCGSYPEDGASAAGKDIEPDGVLPRLGIEAGRTLYEIDSAMSALRRLADRFP